MAHKNKKKKEQQAHRGPTFLGFRPSVEDHKLWKSRHPRKRKHKALDEEQAPGRKCKESFILFVLTY